MFRTIASFLLLAGLSLSGQATKGAWWSRPVIKDLNLSRDQTILNSYEIASLKRGKDDAREVREGMECGIRLEGFNDIKEGDLLEAFRVDEIKRTLD